MIEQGESDREGRPIIRSALTLNADGVRGYDVVLTDGTRQSFLLQQIYTVIYNPGAKTVTFSWPDLEGEVHYSSFKQAEIASIITISAEPESAVLEAERLLKEVQK